MSKSTQEEIKQIKPDITAIFQKIERSKLAQKVQNSLVGIEAMRLNVLMQKKMFSEIKKKCGIEQMVQGKETEQACPMRQEENQENGFRDDKKRKYLRKVEVGNNDKCC